MSRVDLRPPEVHPVVPRGDAAGAGSHEGVEDEVDVFPHTQQQLVQFQRVLVLVATLRGVSERRHPDQVRPDMLVHGQVRIDVDRVEPVREHAPSRLPQTRTRRGG